MKNSEKFWYTCFYKICFRGCSSMKIKNKNQYHYKRLEICINCILFDSTQTHSYFMKSTICETFLNSIGVSNLFLFGKIEFYITLPKNYPTTIQFCSLFSLHMSEQTGNTRMSTLIFNIQNLAYYSHLTISRFMLF